MPNLKLSEAPQITELPDGTKVIVNDGIDIKQIDAKTFVTSASEDKWELICDVTASEDCASFSTDKDINDSSFNLKKCIIYVYYLPPTTVSGFANQLKASFEPGKNIWGLCYHVGDTFVKSDGDIDSVSCSMFEVKNNIVFQTALYIPINHGNVAHAPMVKTDYGLAFDKTTLTLQPATICNQITEIKIGSHSVAVGAGSRFVVYGVRK